MIKAELSDVLVPQTASKASKAAPYYVLLLGSDSRNPENSLEGRSDTIILVRVDPETPALSMLSIPRATEVVLEGYGTQKINAAFAFGGPAGAVKAVSDLCEVDIAHYLEIDFAGLVSLVDRLGGIEVSVPVEIDFDNVHISKGKQYLNGNQALIMSRCRNFPDGDFQRVKNQRLVLQAIMKAVLASGKLELPSLMSDLSEAVLTDVSSTEAIQIVLSLQKLDTKTSLYMATIPSHSNYHDGISYVEVEREAFAAMMERFRAGQPLDGA
jgi:LCP family protein required for cell wall assembly